MAIPLVLRTLSAILVSWRKNKRLCNLLALLCLCLRPWEKSNWAKKGKLRSNVNKQREGLKIFEYCVIFKYCLPSSRWKLIISGNWDKAVELMLKSSYWTLECAQSWVGSGWRKPQQIALLPPVSFWKGTRTVRKLKSDPRVCILSFHSTTHYHNTDTQFHYPVIQESPTSEPVRSPASV